MPAGQLNPMGSDAEVGMQALPVLAQLLLVQWVHEGCLRTLI